MEEFSFHEKNWKGDENQINTLKSTKSSDCDYRVFHFRSLHTTKNAVLSRKSWSDHLQISWVLRPIIFSQIHASCVLWDLKSNIIGCPPAWHEIIKKKEINGFELQISVQDWDPHKLRQLTSPIYVYHLGFSFAKEDDRFFFWGGEVLQKECIFALKEITCPVCHLHS